MCRHPVAAQDFQLPGDDEVHRHEGVFVIGHHQPHLDVTTALAQAQHRVTAGDGAAQRVQRDVRAAARDLVDGFDDVWLRARVEHAIRADALREGQRLVLDVHANDVRPHRMGDHSRRQPHPAAAVDDDPLAGCSASLHHHRPERRDKAASQARRGHEVQRFRHAHQVDVGVRDGDVLRERSPRRESGLEIVVADVLVAGETLRATAAAHRERHSHAVPEFPAAGFLANGFDHTGQFVPWHVWQMDVRIVPHPAVPVAPADAVRLHTDDDAIRRRRGIGDVLDGRWLFKGFVDHGFH